MRVAIVTPGFSASHEDWCIPALHDLVRRLASEHEVTVFALRYPHAREPYDFHGARVFPFGAAQRGRLASAPALVRCLRRLTGEGRARGFDVVHGLWAGETGGLATRAARALGVPAVVSLMGGELADLPEVEYGGFRSRQPGALGGLRARVRRARALASLRRADAVTAGSQFLSELAARRVGCRPQVLPLGVSLARFSPEGASEALPGEPAVLMVGSLIGVKDHASALSAFAAMCRAVPSARPALTIAGDGPLRPWLESRCSSLGIADRVVFRGDVAHDELPALYRGADVCLLSSRHESQAMVVLEAGACGRATVGTRVGILPELVPTSWTATPGNVAGLAAALGRAVEDAGLRDRIGREVGKRVREELSLTVRVQELTKLYRGLVESRGAFAA